jgi:hypothetical protein
MIFFMIRLSKLNKLDHKKILVFHFSHLIYSIIKSSRFKITVFLRAAYALIFACKLLKICFHLVFACPLSEFTLMGGASQKISLKINLITNNCLFKFLR